MRTFVRALLPVAALSLLVAAVVPGATVVATPAATYTLGARDPMLYPTSVAVDSKGQIWVVDGARDRVLVFKGDGTLAQTVRRVAGVNLSRPQAVAASADGRVWIADTGNSRIAVMSAVGTDESALVADKKLGAVDLTDVAVSADGQKLYAVDNDGHRTFVINPANNTWTPRGKKGAGLGAFNRPRTVAVDANGATYVTDVLNGRVQRFDPEGRPMSAVVRYGVQPGQIFRPAGVDEAEGKLWVTDSVLGVVQVFNTDGTLIDVVRDAKGAVLKLDAPIGLDVVGDKVYVVESRPGRVSAFQVASGPGTPYKLTDAKPPSSASEGQECTLCHLDLIYPLDQNIATPLSAVPPKPGGSLWAGSEAACLSCHEGSVLDSRKHIWSGTSHPRGDVQIPTTMKVPPELKLTDGQITCRTCHSAHTLGGSGQQHRSGLMLRVELQPSEVCVACHGDMGGAK